MARYSKSESRFDPARRRLFSALTAGGLAAGLSVSRLSNAKDYLRPIGLPASSTVDLGLKGMQIVITGSGSALPDPFRGGGSCAVVIDGQVLQFDCGRRVMENLMMVNVNPAKINSLFFTNLRFHHIGDYDYYAYMVWLSGRQQPVAVFGPEGTRDMSVGAMKYMHQQNFAILSKMAERDWSRQGGGPTPEPPFIVKDIPSGPVAESDRFKVTCCELALSGDAASSLAYRVDSDYGSVTISGNTGPSQELVKLAHNVDMLIHDCVVPDYGMTKGGAFSEKAWHEREPAAHTTPTELGSIANEAGAKMLVPYHLPPYGSVPAAIEMSSLYYGSQTDASIWADFVAAMRESFEGPIIFAEDRMIFRVQK